MNASEQAPKKKSSKIKEQQNIFMRALIAITYLFRALAYILWSPMLGLFILQWIACSFRCKRTSDIVKRI